MANRVVITKEFSFDAAHQLPNHSGKCSSLHGHTYKLLVTVSGLIIPAIGVSDEGMIIDFSDLKKIVNDAVVSKLDHALLLGTVPLPWVQQYEDMAGFSIETLLKSRVARLPIPVTSAEHLSSWMFTVIQKGIDQLNLATGVRVEKVELFETPSSCATCEREE